MFLGGLEYNDRIDGASTPSGRPAVTPLGDDDMRYMFTDDALPVTPAFLKNQLRYEMPRAQVGDFLTFCSALPSSARCGYYSCTS